VATTIDIASRMSGGGGSEVLQIPSGPGTYILVLQLKRAARLRIGQFGTVHFEVGFYYYCGSARGPGGLAARIKRHLNVNKPVHWHIDYLRRRCDVCRVFFVESGERLECAFAKRLALEIVPGFGSSDCHCAGHLAYSKTFMDPARRI
jgi:Uri superfamily endonuclease